MMDGQRMEFLCEPSLPQPGAITLVLLPGANIAPEDFIDHGVVAALRLQSRPACAVPVRAHTGYYLEGDIVERLKEDVFEPLRSRGHRRFWLAGVSLGGLGALSFLREQADEVEGVILLAPYLATTGVISEVTRAGGLDRWDGCNLASHDRDRQRMAWLKALPSNSTALRRTYLGYGEDDRFIAASLLLAQRLSPERIVHTAGGHDWPTWKTLWRLLLRLDPFGSRP